MLSQRLPTTPGSQLDRQSFYNIAMKILKQISAVFKWPRKARVSGCQQNLTTEKYNTSQPIKITETLSLFTSSQIHQLSRVPVAVATVVLGRWLNANLIENGNCQEQKALTRSPLRPKDLLQAHKIKCSNSLLLFWRIRSGSLVTLRACEWQVKKDNKKSSCSIGTTFAHSPTCYNVRTDSLLRLQTGVVFACSSNTVASFQNSGSSM